jgi:hypothetical protein
MSELTYQQIVDFANYCKKKGQIPEEFFDPEELFEQILKENTFSLRHSDWPTFGDFKRAVEKAGFKYSFKFNGSSKI